MARIRTIKPEFFADEKLGSVLKRDARLLFVGMWVFSDDYGTIRSNPLWIKSNVFPYDEDLRLNDVKTWLDALEKARMIEPFDYNGEGFYNIRTFNAHQKVEKKSRPIVPIDLKTKILSQSGNIVGVSAEISEPEIGSRNHKEEIGNRNLSPKGDGESSDSPPDPEFIYRELKKEKKSIVGFIRENKPSFLQPYVDLWNLFAEEKKLPQILKLNKARRQKFIVRLGETSFDFLLILKKASTSEFLLTGSWFGFDWLIKNETNYLKVIEGNYDMTGKANGKQNGTSAQNTPQPKGFKTEIDYLYDRYCEGQLDRNIILPEYYDKLVTHNYLKAGLLKADGDIDQQKIDGVINFLKSKKIGAGAPAQVESGIR